MEIKGKNIDEVLYNASKELLSSHEYSPRGKKTKEMINATLIIENIEECVLKNPARKLNLKYLNEELEWYMSGDLRAESIAKHAKLWSMIQNPDGTVNSNYGHFVFYQELENFEGSQYDWVIESLKKDKDSRQATINFNQPKHKYTTNKDFFCTVNTQYFIRNNELIGITNMRSNDLIYGFAYDFPFFSYLQQKIYQDLKQVYPDLKLGVNYHNASSLHVYEKHFKMLEDIVNEYKNQKSSKLQDLEVDTGL